MTKKKIEQSPSYRDHTLNDLIGYKETAPTKTPTAKQSTMRRFVLVRREDATGTSGTGVVAEGVEFSNGQVSIHWLSQLESVNVYANAKVLEKLHGHDGRTVVEWIDT